MSKMIKVDSCGGCHIRPRGTCKIYNRHEWDAGPEKTPTMNKILPNCPLEDYPEKELNTLLLDDIEKKLIPCHNCKQSRGIDSKGDLIIPCPHCGNEDPF